MASIRELRKRIRSISNLSQVTRAMEMVAASRMRRAQEQVHGSRPYAAKAWELLVQLVEQPAITDVSMPLFTVRKPIRSLVLVLITANRGLAGGYNGSIIRSAREFLERQDGIDIRLVTVGRKGRDAMRRAGYKVETDFGDLPDRPSQIDVEPIARLVLGHYTSASTDAVFVGYTDFLSVLRQDSWVRRLLPLRPLDTDQLVTRNESTTVMGPYLRSSVSKQTGSYTCEPTMEVFIDQILSRFVELQIFQAVVESLASEHAARMVAMRNANENANDLLKNLRINYNKLRQQSITEEMLDIAGGAEALSASTR